MPTITGDYLTVLNMFTTDTAEKQERLIGAMREVVDNAAYPGWVSSTVHSGADKYGTANFIQWLSSEDLEARYAGEEFKHRTLPLFQEITTSMKLLQTEVAYSQRRSGLGDHTEIGPDQADFAVIEILGVAADEQDELVRALGEGQRWLADVPGYRAHTVLRGLRARGVDGAFVAVYTQWDNKAAHDAFRAQPETDWSEQRSAAQARIDALATWSEWNSYRAVHTRSATAAAR